MTLNFNPSNLDHNKKVRKQDALTLKHNFDSLNPQSFKDFYHSCFCPPVKIGTKDHRIIGVWNKKTY